MTYGLKSGLPVALALCLVGVGALAQHQRDGGRGDPRAETRQAEPHPGPMGYPRATEPPGWSARPGTVDWGAYRHNFQSSRHYKIGPYHRPPGWVDHRWVYGETLPRAFWVAPYVLADYWLFGLEIAPVGYEWVRVGADALLVSTVNGEVLQVVYGVFI